MSTSPSVFPRRILRGTALLAAAALGLASLLASDGGGGGSSRVLPTVDYSVLPTTALAMSSSSDNTATTDAALGVAVIQLDTSWVDDLMIDSILPFILASYVNEPCPGGGTSSLLVSMLSPALFSAGDNYTASFNGCIDDSGVMFDGSMTVTLLAVGDLNNPAEFLPLERYFIGSSLQLIQTNLAVSDATGFLVADGDMTFEADDSLGYVRFTAFGNSVAESDGLRTARMTNYTLWTGTDLMSTLHAFTDYTLADTALGGIIQAATLTPFTTASLDTYPASGTLTVTGQDGNGVHLTAINNTNVQLDYEFNGNGAFDDYLRNSTWAEVSALASIPLGVASQPAPRHPALPALRALQAMGGN